MHLPALMADCELPAGLASIIAGLIERKGAATERGGELVPDAVVGFIDGEFELAREVLPKREARSDAGARDDAEAFFRGTLRRLNAAP